MVTKRTPLHRQASERITPAALKAFAELRALPDRCTCVPERYDRDECANCRQRRALNLIIFEELKLKPWEIGICVDNEPPTDHVSKVRFQRWLRLEAALKAAHPDVVA